MLLSEKAVLEGLSNPFTRVTQIVLASYLTGIFYPIPNTIYHLLIGPQERITSLGKFTVTHTPKFVDFTCPPFVISFDMISGMISIPVFILCFTLSILDMGNHLKVLSIATITNYCLYIAYDIAWSDPSELVLFLIPSITLIFLAFLCIDKLLLQNKTSI